MPRIRKGRYFGIQFPSGKPVYETYMRLLAFCLHDSSAIFHLFIPYYSLLHFRRSETSSQIRKAGMPRQQFLRQSMLLIFETSTEHRE
jgi:hypothetical protein